MLNTADRSPMTALGMMALHLKIADFKFTHNFIICEGLSDTEIIFGIDIFTIIYLGQREELLHTKGLQISHIHPKLQTKDDTRNC